MPSFSFRSSRPRAIDLAAVNAAVAALELPEAVYKTSPWQPRDLVEIGLRQWLRCCGAAMRDGQVVGMPSHAALLGARPAPFTAVEVLPVHPGVREGEDADPAVTEAFCTRARAQRYDLAVQAHGGGGNSNPFLLRLGARHTVGTAAPGAAALAMTSTAMRGVPASPGARPPPERSKPSLNLGCAARA